MTPTPRTDAAWLRAFGFHSVDVVSIRDFCRQRERELAEAREQWRMSSVCRELAAKCEKLEEEIKQLKRERGD